MPPTNNGSTEDVQPPVVPVVHHESISEPVNAPVSAPMPNQKASIPFPSRRNDERRREKANDQIEKFYEIFRDLSFEISFTDALMLMPKFASTLKTLIGNKEKLSEMARTPLNENCSAVILINVTKKNLGDLAISYYILEAITFNLDQTSRYTANYNHMTANQIDVIDMACEEYSQEVLGFSNVISSGNPTPYYDPIVSTSSLTLTPFEDSDFLIFEEADSFLIIEDDPTSPEWIFCSRQFDCNHRDKKGSENLASDHLSRLENPHQDKLENKEITETFPLETLGSVALRVDSTPWFADFANYHAWNFIVRECHPSRKTSFSKMSNTTSGMTPSCSKSIRSSASAECCTEKRSSRILEA
ncbi:hypothetical protein Tco_0823611 [Tanacetum coccineum]|uniref:Reverse transcriptase domain-containing protein n=1 Tax=Tanacetum coccineum TaxID=301880 RepID=A0ABQ5ALS0_9ASTR